MSPEKPPESRELLAQTLSILVSARDDWKDGIPPEEKHSDSEDSHWKIRKAWFYLVAGRFELIERAVLSGQLSLSADVLEKMRSTYDLALNQLRHRKASPEEVLLVNNILNSVIEEIEQR